MDLDQAKILINGIVSTLVIPEALLNRSDVHVDIIFPSNDLLK